MEALSSRILTKFVQWVRGRVGYKPRLPDQGWACPCSVHGPSWVFLSICWKESCRLPPLHFTPSLAKSDNETDHSVLCAQGWGRSPAHNVCPRQGHIREQPGFPHKDSNVGRFQRTEGSYVGWNREKGWWGLSWRRGELRALLIYLIYLNLIYLINNTRYVLSLTADPACGRLLCDFMSTTPNTYFWGQDLTPNLRTLRNYL